MSCPRCARDWYDNPRSAVEALVISASQKVVVCRRAIDPFVGMLELPGGFVDPGENAEAALRRELWEELAIGAKDIKRSGYFGSETCKYPFQGIEYDVLVLQYVVELRSLAVLAISTEISEIVQLSRAELVIEEFAWPDAHRRILSVEP